MSGSAAYDRDGLNVTGGTDPVERTDPACPAGSDEGTGASGMPPPCPDPPETAAEDPAPSGTREEEAEHAESSESAEPAESAESAESAEPDPAAPADPAASAEPEDADEGEDGAAGTRKFLGAVYDLCEVLGIMTAAIMLVFAFGVRLNIVEGASMRPALGEGDTLVVTDFAGTAARGDIVIIHRIDAAPYDKPIVKRVVAVGGETVDIDFSSWILTVDGETVEESYRWLNPERGLLTSELPLPLTLGENEIFVMGDNRNGSADSRQSEIGPVDTRCVVGKAVARFGTGGGFSLIRNPFEKGDDTK